MRRIRALVTAAALALLTAACGPTAGTAGSPRPCPTAGPTMSAVARLAPSPLATAIATGSAVAHSGTVIIATSGHGPYSMSPGAIQTAQAEARSFEESMPSRYPTTPTGPPARANLRLPVNPPTNASASTTSSTACASH